MTFAAVVLVWPTPSWAAFRNRARTRRAPRSSRRPARETRTLTFACSPAAIEKLARPRLTVDLAREPGRRRGVSFVWPEQ